MSLRDPSERTLGFLLLAPAFLLLALILLAGLQMIPQSRYEAAEVDGASRWQQCCQITLPMRMPSIIVALILRTITALPTFDIPCTMTKGGPGDATATRVMLIHKTTIDCLDVGYGPTLAVFMFVLSHRAGAAVHRAQPAGVHAGAGPLFQGHPERS